MTTLSIGGVLPEEQQQYQTNLKLRSWNNNGGQERGFEQQQADMTVYNMSGGSNGLKRKRQSELPSVAMYDNGEARIVLGLGHPDDSSSMDEEDEDSGVVLGLGQSYNGSGSANTNSFCGGDETVHSGHAVSDILGRKAEQPLLRLNSMGDLRSSGSGWSSGSHLGLGTYHATDSSNAAALRLGLSDQGAKGAPFPPLVDEGSSTARLTSGGYMPSLLMGSQIYPAAVDPHFAQQQQQRSGKGRSADEDQQLVEHDLLMSLRATASGGTTSTSGASGSDRAPKVCKFRGCGKGPRGASGLCIAHGGGRSAGAKSMGATRVPKDAPCTAKHTAGGGGAKIWGVPRAPRARRISASATEVGVAAASKAATRPLVGAPGCVSAMAVASAARLRDAPRALKGTQDCASPMVADDGANLPGARKERRGAPCFAKRTEAASGA